MQHCALIIDKTRIVKFDMLSNIMKQLTKARDLTGENTAMFEGLPIVIFIKNFYQFFFVISRLLWDEVCIKKDHYGILF